MVGFEYHAVRANKVLEVCAQPDSGLVFKIEILLRAGPEKVMENTKPVVGVQKLCVSSQPSHTLSQVSVYTAKIGSAVLNPFFSDGKGDVLLLYKIVACGSPVCIDAVGLSSEIVEAIVTIGHKHGSLEICRVKPVIDNAYLYPGICRQRIYDRAVEHENAALILIGCRHIVYIRKTPCAAMLISTVPQTVTVDFFDGN